MFAVHHISHTALYLLLPDITDSSYCCLMWYYKTMGTRQINSFELD